VGGLVASAAVGQVPPGVECRIVDAATGLPTPARVRLVDRAGRQVAPLGHPEQPPEDGQQGDVRFQSKRFSYVDGRFSVDPRQLPLKYQVVKGYEYVIVEGDLTAPAEIRLARRSPLARGWYGGDIHIHHISPKTCRLEMEAEDLHVANILTSDFTEDQREFEGKVNANSGRDRLIYVSQEFRQHELGHMCVLNLNRLLEPVKPARREHYPLHLDACDQAHRQRGYVAWAHFPSWPGVECPLDVVMEKLDGLEIMSQLDPQHFPIWVREVVPELEANDGLRLWYRFLNCGYRLTATAGTDKMTNYVTVGANRVFARVDGELTYDRWIETLRRGRTFVTNAPLLSFTVNGREPGETLQLGSRGFKAVEVSAHAECQFPYDRLEIVVNGEVVADATPSGPRSEARIHIEHPVQRSCWLAARVVEDMKPYRERGVDFTKIHVTAGTRHGDWFGTRRAETVFAHSSPVYVIADGAPIRSYDDAEYYVRYMESSIAWLEKRGKFGRPEDKQKSIEAFREGRARWLARQRQARGR
jgi:hypothetical protein